MNYSDERPVGVLLEDVVGTGRAVEILAERKTIAEWEEVYGVTVIEADGFVLDDDLHRRFFTQDEFLRGARASATVGLSNTGGS